MTNQFRFSLLAFALCTFFAHPLLAQQNAIKMTPFQPVLGKFSLSYEHVTKPKTTMLVEYQRWFENRESGLGFFFLGILASSTETKTNSGYRMSFMARKYAKTALNGSFFEGGLYVGKHQITTRSEVSTLSLDPDFFFLPVYHSTVTEKVYKDVRVGGLRAGAGWQKSTGSLTFECSGGINLNAFNDKNVRPTLGMKVVSPYARLAVGVKF
jgi:hypothetical protein